MGVRRIGGGLLAFVAVAAPAVIQAMGLRLAPGVGYPALGLCALAFAIGILLAFWPERSKEAGVAGDDNSTRVGDIRIGDISGSKIDHIGHNFGPLPRSLTAGQIETLASALSVHKGLVTIEVGAGVSDGEEYAASFQEAFERAGWQVNSLAFFGKGLPPLRLLLNVDSAAVKAAVGALAALDLEFMSVGGVEARPPIFGDLTILIGRRN